MLADPAGNWCGRDTGKPQMKKTKHRSGSSTSAILTAAEAEYGVSRNAGPVPQSLAVMSWDIYVSLM